MLINMQFSLHGCRVCLYLKVISLPIGQIPVLEKELLSTSKPQEVGSIIKRFHDEVGLQRGP